MPISPTLYNLHARHKDIQKAERKNIHEPNRYLLNIRRQLCMFKRKVLSQDFNNYADEILSKPIIKRCG